MDEHPLIKNYFINYFKNYESSSLDIHEKFDKLSDKLDTNGTNDMLHREIAHDSFIKYIFIDILKPIIDKFFKEIDAAINDYETLNKPIIGKAINDYENLNTPIIMIDDINIYQNNSSK